MTLKEMRLEKHLTPRQLAQKSGLGLTTIYKIEAGGKPSYVTIHKLAKGLGCNVDELWELRIRKG